MGHGIPKREAIELARLARLRPVLMTGMVAALGFVPMMLSTGIGAEVQRPLATVVFFGMVCDTFLTMLALPVLYLLFGKGPQPLPELGEKGRQHVVPRPLAVASSVHTIASGF
jgi:cobalt-zinc-cadmium resistance protein CzcA